MNNVFIERLRRSFKHEDIHSKSMPTYADDREAQDGIASWIAFHTRRRFHQTFGYRPPKSVWPEGTAAAMAAS
jgi:hypothetical protein